MQEKEKKPETIKEYISMQDPAVQERLEAIYKTIREAIPEAEEKISWSMPTFWKNHNLIHFAAGKHHIGIYPGPDAILAFEDVFKENKYKYSKGAVQLPDNKELPLDLVRKMAKWCWDNEMKNCS